MHLLAESSIVIACPPERAFAIAANLENFPRWFPGVLAIVSADSLPFATVGKRYRETVAMPLRGTRSVLIRVIEAASPHRLVTEGSLPLLLPRMEMDVTACEAGRCRVTWRMYSRNARGWRLWVVLPLARRVMMRRAKIGLRRLERLLESDGVA